ncbi:MAG: hypothetical protein LBE92_10795 [Chryseobacterium sp.]|uniref:hypothetical protein n=1 Tax=Chryseobacterium sp. TaxID=1871047 RepID=UPI002838604C|nr:hypothetical protein [Chryseobacterium sp.]MDR2236603.1 hypothetical protein [Chryseobacterium sp.]
MMKNTIILFFVATSLLSCQNKNPEIQSESENTQMNIDLIKKHLKLQEKIELSENDTDTTHLYHLTEIDIELGGEIVSQGLKNNNYKVPQNNDFEKKVKEVFVNNCDCKYAGVKKHNNFNTYILNPNMESNIEKTEYNYTYDHIFSFPQYKLIVTLPLLNDIVEVQNNNSLKIHLDQNTIARNKYLFNNSDGDLAWLWANDKEFLKNLVIYFGYDKDKKLNDWVISNLYKEYLKEGVDKTSEIGNIIFVKNCENNLTIRKGLLNYVEKYTTKDDDKYITALSQYMINELYNDDKKSSFTDEEKAEIVAHISNIEIQGFNKYKGVSTNAWTRNASTLFYLQSKNAMNHFEILDILKKHNYFGFSFLKNYIESGELENEIPPTTQGDEY